MWPVEVRRGTEKNHPATNTELLVNAPWTILQGLSRSLLMVAIGLTFLITPSNVLFTDVMGVSQADRCQSNEWAFYCFADSSNAQAVVWLAGTAMLIGAMGYIPQFFTPLAAYLAVSFSAVGAMVDGGDQAAGILLTLLALNAITDPRLNHWTRLHNRQVSSRGILTVGVATVAVWMARVQMCVIYFFASTGKFGSQEWVDGSSLYYWVRHVTFGAPEWLKSFVWSVTAMPPLVSAITWGTLLLEIALSLSAVLPSKARRILFPLAILFHLGIFFILGISSFAVVMIAGLVVLLIDPAGRDLVSVERPTSKSAMGSSTFESKGHPNNRLTAS